MTQACDPVCLQSRKEVETARRQIANAAGMGRRVKRHIAIPAFAVFLALGGCAASPQVYPGPPLPPGQVSTLHVDAHFGWATSVALIQVDDRSTDTLLGAELFKSTEYFLLPGQHMLLFTDGQRTIFHISLLTLPGHRYRITRTGREQLTVLDESSGVKRVFDPTDGNFSAPPSARPLPAAPAQAAPPDEAPPAHTYSDWLRQNESR